MDDILKDKTNIQALISKLRWDPELKIQIIELTSFLNENVSLSERLYCLHNDIKSTKKCSNINCLNEVPFIKYSLGYNQYCSQRCRNSSDIVKNKRKLTNTNRYGGSSPMNSKRIKEKFKKTCLERYSVENPSQHNDVKLKKIETTLQRFGVENPSQSPEILFKKKETFKSNNNGIDHWTKNPKNKSWFSNNLKEKSYERIMERLYNIVEPQFSIDDYIGVDNNVKYSWKCKTCNYIFTDTLDNGNIPKCPVCNKKKTVSVGHQEIADFITKNTSTKVILNDRKVIYPYEIDIYLPDLGIAIEHNGMYWHSELKGKDRKYHVSKTNTCERNNIKLIQIFDYEWVLQPNIVKSRLLHLLNASKERIHSRKCTIREVASNEKKYFLIENHIQGNSNSSINLGLYHENELVSIMTFGKSRFNKHYEWELLRFCNKNHVHIPGSASKLLSYFEKTYSPKSLITYADRRWSSGNLYKQIGFTYSHTSNPNYFYFKSSKKISMPESRNSFQKHKLKKALEKFNPHLTEWENMKLNGYNRIWDCGNLVFVKSY